jgi:hypothetical protein
MKLFEKTYDGESIVDIGRDIDEVFDDSNLESTIPVNKHGFMSGTFVVTVHWKKMQLQEGDAA